MGKFGCGSINNNGERLVEFCASNDLVIGGTLFNHPAIHRLTWYSPNGWDKNQIDHIAINGIWRGSLLDVRVKRGADVGSDHLLVIVNIRLKLRRTDQRHADHRRSITTAPIKNKEGQLLTSETAQEARWTEHFNEVLNRPAPETEPDIQEAEEDLDVATTPPTKEEIIRAIKSLKNNKAPGPDFLNAELFKSDPPLAAEILLPLLTTAWNKKEIPEDWKEGVISLRKVH
ncbi:hypothetical protein RRG08_000183 [Elysia crispata]|uniref:Endonuclease/exonuclease/phosphatase domain-containing protein n=1 Tax=Elysia crispata TaxID=231223 RepID=A0AAE0YUY5_9GAST|nr:hypothetical protein RRG08_000183 [Elysia crispata]